jgi:sugar porter (SP) family MFS transporter
MTALNVERKPPLNWFLIKAISSASLGGILFGYDMGVVSGALPELTRSFNLEATQQEMIVSFLYLGCCIGSTVGGALCDFAGRKKSILFTDVIFVVGAAVLYQSSSLSQLLFGRVVVGIAVAISGIADVAYLHEISPTVWRGSIISVNEGCISLGFMLSYLSGYSISMTSPKDGWRLMFGIGAIIALLQLLGMSFMPESPVWLKEKGYFAAADRARRTIEAEAMEEPPHGETIELAPTQQLNTGEQDPIYGSMKPGTPYHQDFALRTFIMTYRKQIIITLFLAIIQEFCGHPNVLNFAPEIFDQIGYSSSKSSLLGTFLLGVVKFISTCIVILNIERIGRRKLLIIGIGLICVGNLFVGLSLLQKGVDTAMGQAIAVIGIFSVAIGYAVSFGPLTWLIVSEMFPPWIRGRALGASLFITYIALFLVSFTFLSGQKLGKAIPFLCYFGITLISIIFVFLAIPDTGSKSSEQIDIALNEMPFWRKREPPLILHDVESTAII